MTVTLTPQGKQSLEAICDTFVPGGDGLPSACELGVPDAILMAVGENPSELEKEGFAGLLDGWDAGFKDLPQAEREQVLVAMADSDDGMQRAAFQALRKGILLTYYCLPWAGDGPNPIDAALGYPGPIGPPADPPPRAIEPLAISGDTELDCDVVIAGSGAGGGVAAGVLAAAGLDVIVVEAGGYYSEQDFDGAELPGYARLYQNGGGVATADQAMGLLAGACLGGGTIVNYTWSFRLPDHVREDWRDRFGLEEWMGPDYDASEDAVWERIGVHPEETVPSRDVAFRRGLDALGWDNQVMERNTRGCTEEVCRGCSYGCQSGAKQSTLKTYLQDAVEAGARVLVDTPVDRVIIEGGEARGVEARTRDGHQVTIRSRAVVCAAGAIHTPAILARSRLDSEAVGKNLRVHPVLLIWGVYEEEIDPWTGVFGATYCDELLNMGEGYGVKYMHASTLPSVLAIFGPWRGAARHRELMGSLKHMYAMGSLQRARDGGEITVGRDGLPYASWALSDFDREVMRKGLDGAAQIHEAAGARQVFSSHAGWVHFDAAAGESRSQLLERADACGWGPAQATLGSFHLMGTAHMGADRESAVCDPTGEAWAARNLFVCDGSVLPTCLGVNPMITIEAAAHKIARGIAAKLS